MKTLQMNMSDKMGPTKAYIWHKNLIHNLKLIQNAVAPSGVMGVVKANAYGHGSIEVAKTLIANGVKYLGVAFYEEGVELRKAGIVAPILVFGAHLPNFFSEFLEYDLDITLTHVSQLEPLRLLCRSKKKKARVQIKVDTGMGRVGFFPDQDFDLIRQIIEDSAWNVVGIYSHLSSADEADPTYTLGQIERFSQFKEKIQKITGKKFFFHLANSAAIMRFPQTYFDMVRPGVMLYGSPPGPDFKLEWDLRQVMEFKSKITLIKKLSQGKPVSYSRRYYTPQKTFVGVVPAGYADGYNRRFTNRGEVLIKGRRYPVVGTVCMDQFMVNLGAQTDVEIGDEVVIFGRQKDAHISIVEVSRKLETIPYEITCWVSRRVARIHYR